MQRATHFVSLVLVVLLAGAASAQTLPLSQYEVTPLDLRGDVIRDIEVHPTSPNIVFLIGAQGGLYRSTDHGDNWTHVLGTDGRGLGIDHRNPDRVYAGGFGGIFRSDDGGDTWARVLDKGVRSVGVHPVTGVVFGGGNSGVVYRSDDGGATWTEPPRTGDGEINKWVFHPTDGDVIFHSAAKNRGIYISRDGGRNFELAHEEYGRCVAISPSDPNILYASRSMSRDGGKTWQSIGGGSAWAVAIHPKNPDIVYKATQGDAVYVTHNGGRSWRLARGLRRGGATDLTAHWSAAYDGENDIVYIGAAVLYKAHNASSPGAELVEAGAGINTPRVRTLHGTDKVVWAGTDGQGVVRSADFGRTWERKLLGLRSKLNLGAMSIHPADNNVIYAAGEGGLVRTTNGGEVWVHLPSPGYVNEGTGIVVDPDDVNRIWLLAGRSAGKVFISEDGGYRWQPWAPLAERDDVRRFIMHPTRSNSLVIQLQGEYQRSDDGGRTWKSFAAPIEGGGLLVSKRPQTPDVYYIVRDQRGVWRTDDGGKTWTQIVEGGRVGSGRLVEDAAGNIWLGNTSNLQRSADAGQTWETLAMPGGVNTLLIAPSPAGASANAGVFVGLQNGVMWVHPPDMSLPPAKAAQPPQPNPEHAIVQISAGGVLDRPNTTYQLTGSFTTPATAFFVTADDITIDGQGREVTFDHSGVEAMGVANLTIRNIKLTQSGERKTSHGNAHGIDLAFCDHAVIENVTVSTAVRGSHAMSIDGQEPRIEHCTIERVGAFSTGIVVAGRGAIVRHNRITATAPGRAMHINDSPGAKVEHNKAQYGGSTPISGVTISASDGIVFANNVIEGSAQQRPLLDVSFTSGFRIVGNTLTVRGVPALRIEDAADGKVIGNTMAGSTSGEDPWELINAAGVTMRDNTAH